MGAAAAGALSRASGGCVGGDPDHRAALLVRGLYRFCHPHHGRSSQGVLRGDIWRDAGVRAPVVLDFDRRRSGAAPSHGIRPVDLYGGELAILPVSGRASVIPLSRLMTSGPVIARPCAHTAAINRENS